MKVERVYTETPYANITLTREETEKLAILLGSGVALSTLNELAPGLYNELLKVLEVDSEDILDNKYEYTFLSIARIRG